MYIYDTNVFILNYYLHKRKRKTPSRKRVSEKKFQNQYSFVVI